LWPKMRSTASPLVMKVMDNDTLVYFYFMLYYTYAYWSFISSCYYKMVTGYMPEKMVSCNYVVQSR